MQIYSTSDCVPVSDFHPRQRVTAQQKQIVRRYYDPCTKHWYKLNSCGTCVQTAYNFDPLNPCDPCGPCGRTCPNEDPCQTLYPSDCNSGCSSTTCGDPDCDCSITGNCCNSTEYNTPNQPNDDAIDNCACDEPKCIPVRITVGSCGCGGKCNSCSDVYYIQTNPSSQINWNDCDKHYYQLDKRYNQLCEPYYQYQKLCYEPTKQPWSTAYSPGYKTCC
jgi:hypothetical protein